MSNITSNKILLNNSGRLGIQDPLTIRKAEEFLRVLNCKGAVKTISDVAKTVLCLDLAATNMGIGFDKETALKLTGLRKTLYLNNLNNIEKLLNLDKPITVSELCVQLSCTEVKETAETILTNYKENDTKIKDINHPQYVAAAVYTACSLKKIKVIKYQFIAVSRLKNAQWKELVDEFAKFAEGLKLVKKIGCPKKDKTDNNAKEIDKAEKQTTQEFKKREEIQVEEYEVWRERILKEAAAEILNREISD